MQAITAKRIIIQALLLPLLLSLSLSACAKKDEKETTSTADTNRPIRVVRVGHGDVEGLKTSILIFALSCQGEQGLPPTPPLMPSDAQLAKFAVFEHEELFDGKLWAHYKTERQIAGDPTQGCKLVMFVQRSVEVSDTCGWRINGYTASMDDLIDREGKTPPPPTISETKLSGVCSTKADPDPNSGGVPLIDAGAGARCHWSSAVSYQYFKKLGLPVTRSTEDDVDGCYYEKAPFYWSQGQKRPVILKMQAGLFDGVKNGLVKGVGSLKAGNQYTKFFSDGTAIPAHRFTREAVDAFIHLPSKTTLGELE